MAAAGVARARWRGDAGSGDAVNKPPGPARDAVRRQPEYLPCRGKNPTWSLTAAVAVAPQRGWRRSAGGAGRAWRGQRGGVGSAARWRGQRGAGSAAWWRGQRGAGRAAWWRGQRCGGAGSAVARATNHPAPREMPPADRSHIYPDGVKIRHSQPPMAATRAAGRPVEGCTGRSSRPGSPAAHSRPGSPAAQRPSGPAVQRSSGPAVNQAARRSRSSNPAAGRHFGPRAKRPA